MDDGKRRHAKNFIDTVNLCLNNYKAGVSPGELADNMMALGNENGFSQWLLPGCEHGIGVMGDEWRIGTHQGPVPYWTSPNHIYQAGEMLICAIQYACPEDNVGFRYENPIIIEKDGCEVLSKYPFGVDDIT